MPDNFQRRGTTNGPSLCLHGKSMKTDNCEECKKLRAPDKGQPLEKQEYPEP